MKKIYILVLSLLIFAVPSFADVIGYGSTFEEVLNKSGNYSWSVNSSQVLLKEYENSGIDTYLIKWNSGGNVQKANKITITGYPKNSYDDIYFKPCQPLVMEKYDIETNTYKDNFRMNGIIVGTYEDNKQRIKPQSFNAKNITLTSFVNGITNNGGNISLSNTNFIKNKGINGGAIYNESGNVIIDKSSNLYYNLASNGGGAVYNSQNGNLTVKNSVIGGQHNEGIYYICNPVYPLNPVYHIMSNGTLSVTDSEGKDILDLIHSLPNSDITYKVDKYLGNDNWIIIYYLIPEWRNVREINWPEEDSSGKFNSQWVHVYPLGNEAKYGAGIYNEGNANITGTTFKYNIAKKDSDGIGGYGGGIYNSGKLTVKNSRFYYNKAECGAGIYNVSNDEKKVLAENSTFSFNQAEYGACAYIESGKVIFNKDTFGEYGKNPSNKATYGGGIYNGNYGNVIITSSNFTNNKAEKGGDIYNIGTLSISKTNFGAVPKEVYFFGGIQPVFYVDSGTIMEWDDGKEYVVRPIYPIEPIHLTPIRYVMSSNAVQGGAIYNKGVISDIKSSTFNGANAFEGGAIYNDTNGCINVIKQTKFKGNYTFYKKTNDEEEDKTPKGGAIYNKGHIDNIEKITFTDNYSEKGQGGAIYNESGIIGLKNSTFDGNYAQLGGALYVFGGSIDDLKSTFKNNYSEKGGAIYNDTNGNIELNNTVFVLNNAYKTAEIEDDDGNLEGIENVLSDGGAIYNKGILTLNNVLFGNKSKKYKYTNRAENGSAIYNTGVVNSEISNILYQDSTNGAIYNIGTFNSVRDNFLYNKANIGSSIYGEKDSITKIEGSIFTSNTATSGGAIYTEGCINIDNKEYSVIKKKKEIIKIAQIKFSKNFVTENGGAIYLANTAQGTIKNADFTQNKAYKETTETKKIDAKTEYKDGKTIIKEPEKTVVTITPSGAGGAIYVGGILSSESNNETENISSEPQTEHVKISGTEFKSNSAGLSGGAIYVEANSLLDIEDSDFSNNSAYSLIITKTTQKSGKKNKTTTDKTAQGEGGAIYISGNSNVEINKTTFNKNKSNEGGAIFISSYEKPKTESQTEENNNENLSDNDAQTDNPDNTEDNTTNTDSDNVSGSEQNSDSTSDPEPTPESEPEHIKINKSEFSDNIAYGYGGAIFNSGYLDLKESIFIGNNSTYGGAISNLGSGNILVENCYFDGNLASAGGAIYNLGTAIIKKSDFNNTKKFVVSAGGAIFNQGGTINIENSNFNNNIAQMGGAIYNTYVQSYFYSLPGTINSHSNKYLSNISYQGGALINVSATFNSVQDEFKNNNATYGGAIYSAGTLKLEDTIFDSNQSSFGTIYSSSNIDAKGGEFKDNKANVGGAIYIFAPTSTDKDGKIVYSAVIKLDDVNFTKNSTTAFAGGIYISGADLTIDNSIFDGNSAKFAGGALFVEDSNGKDSNGNEINRLNKVKIVSTTFKNNFSEKGIGGAIYSQTSGTIYLNVDEPVEQKDEQSETDSTSDSENNNDNSNPEDNISDNNNDNQNENNNLTGDNSESNDITVENEIIEYAPIVFDGNYAENGGAIYNYQGNILGDKLQFENNKASDKGGAVYNAYRFVIGDETVTTSVYDENLQINVFKNNSAKEGGAIYNLNYFVLNGIQFSKNYGSAKGGAIYHGNNYGRILNTKFIDNYSNNDGGAIYVANGDKNTLSIYTSMFENNKSLKSDGGAIYLGEKNKVNICATVFKGNSAVNGGAIYAGKYSTLTIQDSSFIDNKATGKGGAIFIDKYATVNIISETSDVIFDHNYDNVKTKDEELVGVLNAIHLNGDSNSKENTILNLIVKDSSKHKIIINDYISGVGKIAISGDTELKENLRLSSDSDITIQLDSGTTDVNNEESLNNAHLSIGKNARLNIANNSVRTMSLKSLALENNTKTNISIDMDLKTGKSDKIVAEFVEGKGILNASVVNLLSDSKTSTTINIGEDSLVTEMTATKAETAQATYRLKTGIDKNGYLTATAYGQKAKPAVVAAPVAAQLGGYLTQVNSYDQAFGNLDFEMTNTYEERQANDMRMELSSQNGKLKIENGKYLNQTSSDDIENKSIDNVINPDSKGLWNRTYATFERVGLTNGPKVGNIAYGNFFGGDMGKKHLRNGWKRQFSAYIGYNGSTQDFDRQSIDQNGGTLGVMETWYKGNFFTALTANVSGNFADAHTDIGREQMAMIMAGVASKTGYNFEIKLGRNRNCHSELGNCHSELVSESITDPNNTLSGEQRGRRRGSSCLDSQSESITNAGEDFFRPSLIIQPNLLLSYSFVHTFAHNNGMGNRVSSSPLNAIQVAPGIKFIANLKNGWQPYINLNMRWNIMDKTSFNLPDVNIPDMSIRPYFEYGVGLQKRWGERFTGYGQVLMRNGGRNGVMLSVGFRWALGK